MLDRLMIPVAAAALLYLLFRSGPSQAALFDPYVEVETSGAGMDDETYRQYLIANGYDPDLYGFADPALDPAPAAAGPGGEDYPLAEPDAFDYTNVIQFPGQNADDAAGAFAFPSDQQDTGSPMSPEKNLAAFLMTIRFAEGTPGPDGYATLYGYSSWPGFTFDDHPSNRGWPGVKLPDALCKGAGLKPGCVTTAAGAYQFISTTWNGLKAKLGLPDFSPASQDAAATELIREKGALEDVYAGRFVQAVQKISKIWASMPGAGYAQPEVALDRLANVYTGEGGEIAA